MHNVTGQSIADRVPFINTKALALYTYTPFKYIYITTRQFNCAYMNYICTCVYITDADLLVQVHPVCMQRGRGFPPDLVAVAL